MIYSCLVNEIKTNYFVDPMLFNQLTENVKPKVQKKDFDYFFIIDGEEGSGKSVFAMQCAKILDHNFSIANIAFTAQEFNKIVTSANPHQCVVFDEAFTGLSSRASLTEMNRLLVELMMEMRQKNLFVIIVMPSFFMLEKYVVLHRAKCMFHVYLDSKGNRGRWVFYNRRYMKYVYLNYRKTYSYPSKYTFRGHFSNVYAVNEQEYRVKKKESLTKKNREIKLTKFKEQRNLLIDLLYRELNFPVEDIVQLLLKKGIKMTGRNVYQILERYGDTGVEN